jgi:hypothetical protein
MAPKALFIAIIVTIIGLALWYLFYKDISKLSVSSVEWGLMYQIFICYSALMIACIGSVLINIGWYIFN